MAAPKDPTDAPFIPSMGGALTPDPGDVDTDMPGTPGAPPSRVAEPEDPVALARRLAEEAKQKAQAAKPKEDPAALAKRLAEEAKQKAQAAKPKEDPAALAKRLAEEAKKKAQASKPKEDPAALAKRLAEEAKNKAQASKPKPAPAAEEPASDRFGGLGAPRVKRKSAAEILAEARAAEERAQAEAEEQKQKAAMARAKVEEAKQRAAAAPEPAPAPAPAVDSDPEAIITGLLSDATVIVVKRPTSVDVMRAVWSAHLARAQASADLDLAVASSSILGALDRVGAEGIAAAEVRISGREYAVFVELGTGALIAAARPAHVYLAGA